MQNRKRSLAAAVTVAVLASVGLGAGTAEAAVGPTVSSWITTPDRSQLLAQGPSATFNTDGARPGQMINLDPNQRFQTMDGFGASITDSSAAVLYRLPAAQRDQVMSSIFHPVNGIGMSFLRQPIGGSDFIDEAPYTYNDLPAGQTDLPMARFSIAHDEAQILPLLRQARALNPGLKVIATPWGQPAWMKANNSLIGGRMKDDPAIFQAYALYLVKFVQAYQAAGVPIYALTVQNEPQNRAPSGYAGTDMPVAHQVAIINRLGPMLRDAGLGQVKIISYDHNWAEHPDDIASANAAGVDPEPNYPYDVLRSSAAQWIAGTGYHCYYGDASAQTALHNAFPTKDIWFTECSGWHGAADPFTQYFSDTLKWHALNLGIGTTKHWAKSVVNWNLALDPNGGPHNGGCGDATGWCSGVVTVNGTTVTRNAEYYTLGHLSKFVKPGAVRIGSNDAGDLRNVAFTNPDGSTAVFVANTGGGTQTFGVSWNGMFVSATLPPGAIATLTWPAGGASGDTTPPTTPANLAATGTTSTSTNLSWTASTDNVGVTGYLVYRNGTQVGTSTSTGYTDAGLTASTTYSYTVRARDGAGNLSPASNTLSVTTTSTGGGGTIDPTRWYQVINQNSNKCADNAGWGTSNGSALQQWSCGNPPQNNQTWQFRPTSNGWYQVVNRHAPALAWDVNGGIGATGNGTDIHLWAYAGGTNQQWQPVALGGGQVRFVARHSGKCLDVRDVSTSDGARLQQWTCTGGPAQSFRLVAQP
jgi:glucosylceramidase